MRLLPLAIFGFVFLGSAAPKSFANECSPPQANSSGNPGDRYEDGQFFDPRPLQTPDGPCEQVWTFDAEGRYGWHLWYAGYVPAATHYGIPVYQCTAVEVNSTWFGSGYTYAYYDYDLANHEAITRCQDNQSQCRIAGCNTYFDCFDCGREVSH